MESVTVRVPGKVNLSLEVGETFADGYHALATIMQAVSIYDEVTVRTAERLAVTVEGFRSGEVPADRSNLAARAAILLAERLGTEANVHIHIRKGLPTAGGMAGGSADAAAALVALGELWDVDLTTADLHDLGAGLGMDVPFLFAGATAFATGRGERLAPVPVKEGARFHWTMALSSFGLSTPKVFAEFDRLASLIGRPPRATGVYEGVTAALRSGDPVALGAALHNDLHEAAFSLAPSLRRTLEAGRAGGALAGIVSGTGATCAFLVEDEGAARRLAVELEASGACLKAEVAQSPVDGATAATRYATASS